jgi:hypothetical protein
MPTRKYRKFTPTSHTELKAGHLRAGAGGAAGGREGRAHGGGGNVSGGDVGRPREKWDAAWQRATDGGGRRPARQRGARAEWLQGAGARPAAPPRGTPSRGLRRSRGEPASAVGVASK